MLILFAKKYFPNETLVINEGTDHLNIANRGIWSAYYLEIENALLKGVPIDKIGIQHHLFTGATSKTEEAYERNVKTEYPKK